MCEHEHSHAHLGILFHNAFNFCGQGFKHEFGCAEHERSRLVKAYGREFSLGGEGYFSYRRQSVAVAEMVVKGNGSLVVIVQRSKH